MTWERVSAGATNTSTAQALKRDLCNIMAAKAGAFLTQRSSFLMYANVTFRGHHAYRVIYGFSFKTMKFTELDKNGYCEWSREKPSLEHVEGSPAMFMLRLEVNFDPVPIKVLINVNERVHEVLNILDLDDAEDYAISVSFSDSDVYDGGDEYKTGDWTYHDPEDPTKKEAREVREAEEDFIREVEEDPGAYGVETWNY
jgi:hypothetical protein